MDCPGIVLRSHIEYVDSPQTVDIRHVDDIQAVYRRKIEIARCSSGVHKALIFEYA